MKKLILLAIVGLFALASPSYAILYGNSTNKTLLQTALTSGGLAPLQFVTASASTSTITACPGYTIGTGASIGTILACPGQPITGLMLSGGASGGTVAIYDAATNQYAANQATNGVAEVGASEAVFEATVAASTQSYIDLSDAPINTQNGIVAVATSTSGVVVYGSTAGTTNR